VRIEGKIRGRRVIQDWGESNFHNFLDSVWIRANELWDDVGEQKKKGPALALFQKAIQDSVLTLMEGACTNCGSRRIENVEGDLICSGCRGVRG
jgi:hypothetical protein